MLRNHQYEQNQFVLGEGCAIHLANLLDDHGVERAMIVCGENVAVNEQVMSTVSGALGPKHVCTFDGVKPDTPLEVAEEGVAKKRAHDVDGLVSVGGGSASDTAKAISVLDAEIGRSIHEMKSVANRARVQETSELPAEKDPIFAVSTTLSAAEVSNAVGVTDTGAGEKVGILDEKIRPKVCLYDPELTATTPSSVVASTGMNALDHAVELLYSDRGADNPFYEATAEKALELLMENLAEAVNNRTLDAIQDAQVGSAISALGLTDGLCINHGINHALCARHPVSHGDGNSILLPHGVRFNFQAVPERIVTIGAAMGIDTRSKTAETVCDEVLDAIETLQRDIDVPTRLRDVGVDRDDFEDLATVAVHDWPMANNPREVTEADIVNVLEAAW